MSEMDGSRVSGVDVSETQPISEALIKAYSRWAIDSETYTAASHALDDLVSALDFYERQCYIERDRSDEAERKIGRTLQPLVAIAVAEAALAYTGFLPTDSDEVEEREAQATLRTALARFRDAGHGSSAANVVGFVDGHGDHELVGEGQGRQPCPATTSADGDVSSPPSPNSCPSDPPLHT